MNYAFFVEGPDDNRFIEQVIKPNLSHRRFSTMQYSEEPNDTVDTAISAFQGMHRELFFLTDFDYGNQGCTSIEDRKDRVREKYPNLEREQIIVVDDAIEAWYLSGKSDSQASEYGFDLPEQTDGISKDEFEDKMARSSFSSHINLKIELIDGFSIDEAKSRNSSFNYFCNRIEL